MDSRKSVFTLILLTLVFFKVSSAAIHVSLHHEQKDATENHCEHCERVIYNQNLGFYSALQYQTIADEQILDFVYQIDNYISVRVSLFSDNSLFVRPPPTSFA